MPNRKNYQGQVASPAVGHRPKAFAKAIGISKSTLYALPAHLQPRSMKFGRARIITEDPAAYLARVASETPST